MAIRLEMACDILTADDCATGRVAGSPRAVCPDGSQMGVVRKYQQLVNLAYSEGWVRTGHLISCPACQRPATALIPSADAARDQPSESEGPAKAVSSPASGKVEESHIPAGHPHARRVRKPHSVDQSGQELSLSEPPSSASSSHGGS